MDSATQVDRWKQERVAAQAIRQGGGGQDKWVGRIVKIGFDTNDDRVTKEWMWVRVASARSGTLVGVLDNDPVFSDLRLGDTVTFTEDEIVAVCVDGEAEVHPVSSPASASGRSAAEQSQDALTSPSHECRSHEWAVFSTALADGVIMLQCIGCGLHGTVDDPSKGEWAEAFHAATTPYRWDDDGRVTRRGVGPLYVRAMQSGGYERLPREAVGPLLPLDEASRKELLEAAEVVEATGDLDSGLFPYSITSFEEDTGESVCTALKRAASRIEQCHRVGHRLAPRQVAWVLRCHASESPPAAPQPVAAH